MRTILLGTGSPPPNPKRRGPATLVSVGGREPVPLPTGETRAFLEDGDELTIAARCEADGAVRIGFGDCRGRVEPA